MLTRLLQTLGAAGALLLLSLPAHAAAPGWLAFGDLRGHIEPCGCDPATDLGGIKRLGLVLERERAVHPDAWLFDLGNDVPPATEDRLKTEFLVTAANRLAPTATLLNELEIGRLAELEALRSEHRITWPRYVLSNARAGSPLAKAAAPVVDDGKVVVLGYVGGSHAGLEPYAPALAERWKKELAAHPGRFKILLYSGPDAALREIAATRLFDAIVSSNTSPMATPPGTAERDDESRLVRLKDPVAVAMVPLAGQGLLRGGALMTDEAKSVTEILKGGCGSGTGGLFGSKLPENCQPAKDAQPGLFGKAKLVTWLDPATATSDGPLKDVYDRYTAAAQSAFRSAGAERLKDLKNSPFAGSAACVSCHPAESKIYAGTQHAHAMATLEGKKKQEDPECVSCHSVGAKAKGGFVSLAASPQLANVQCENCHGPRLAHTKDPVHAPKPGTPAREMCVTCHNAQHSPKFAFDVYWPRIKHP